jgi:hypothetical protein
MTVIELIEMLQDFPQDKRVDFIVWDGQDNWEANLAINEFKQNIDFELVLPDYYIIIKETR